MFFLFQNNPKDQHVLDPSCKIHLGLWDTTPSYNQGNSVPIWALMGQDGITDLGVPISRH